MALCATYPDRVLFLDIETTGLSHYYDEITIVGWSLDGRASTLVRGADSSCLFEECEKAKVLVTFNGIRFDKRFLLQEFPDLILPDVHIDLMYLCRRVGLTGGQKAIENSLGLHFREDIAEVDGFAAVLLWHRYLRGDLAALETLIRYNRADIAAMGAILDATLKQFTIHPDLFASPVKFLDWSAPKGWRDLPCDLKPAARDLSNVLNFDNLFEKTPATQARVVGIDLTGSAVRGSGWCELVGARATTTTLHTDEEILDQTIAAKPHLVSIDSPLCLPTGRISVEDSDPGRDQFGIMRWCERELKRRGINVYPSLLPTMQKLTARGIQIADILRGKGIPVIESYPGAAQDIMRIPRKGAGVEWLKLGLREFGISGNFQDENVTHDELDAITSALVGTFHLANLSEALGTDTEPPLIIPEVNARSSKTVIGISGPIAAGKTTFAAALERVGFSYTRFSMVIDNLLVERGLELNRVNRQCVGLEIKESGSQRWLAEMTVARVATADRIVVDGLRFPEDHAYLIERFGGGVRHIFVQADEGKRRVRYRARENGEDFDQSTCSEVESKITEMKALAHEVFVNNADKTEVDVRVGELVDYINGEKLCLFLS